MRHAIVLGAMLLAAGESQASGSTPPLPPCREGVWVGTGSMSVSRDHHAAVLLPSGKVLVAGGTGLASAELYDPETGSWSPTGSMNIPRQDHTLTLLPTGKALAVGGTNFEGRDTGAAELYDPQTGQWTLTGVLLDGREFHTATLLPTGEVLIAGGYGLPGPMTSAELYDPATGEWRHTGPLSTARFEHTATLLDSGNVLALGGVLPTSSAELYDPAAGTWTTAAPMLTRRFGHTATRIASGVVLVVGGFSNTGSQPALFEAELHDPVSGSWRTTGAPHAPHSGHTATLLPSGAVLVVDGTGGGPYGFVPNTELFDPGSETWSDAGCTVEARAAHTATLLPSGAVLVAGGRDATAELYGLVVSPARVSLTSGASQSFTVRGGSGLGRVWSFVENASGGSLSPTGDYRAGPLGGVTDVIRVVDSSAHSGTATVDVMRPPTAVAATTPQAGSMGCASTGADRLAPGAVLALLLAWSAGRSRGAIQRRWPRAPAE